MANLVHKPCVSPIVVMIVMLMATTATSTSRNHRVILPIETTRNAMLMTIATSGSYHHLLAKRRVPPSGPSRRGHRKVFPIS